MNPHRQHTDMIGIHHNRRTERVLGILLAVAIGVGLAAALVSWWSA